MHASDFRIRCRNMCNIWGDLNNSRILRERSCKWRYGKRFSSHNFFRLLSPRIFFFIAFTRLSHSPLISILHVFLFFGSLNRHRHNILWLYETCAVSFFPVAASANKMFSSFVIIKKTANAHYIAYVYAHQQSRDVIWKRHFEWYHKMNLSYSIKWKAQLTSVTIE